jgi:hypothetical protein
VRCGALAAEDCATDHWCPEFDGRRENAGWRAACPLCLADRALSWKVASGRVAWWTFCTCPEDALRAKLAMRLPDCMPRRARRQPNLLLMESLAADKSVTVNALRVAILQELGWTAGQIRAELKMPRQTWSDAVRKLGQRPRSAPAENSDTRRNGNVRKLGQRPRSNT